MNESSATLDASTVKPSAPTPNQPPNAGDNALVDSGAASTGEKQMSGQKVTAPAVASSPPPVAPPVLAASGPSFANVTGKGSLIVAIIDQRQEDTMTLLDQYKFNKLRSIIVTK